jgi:putative MATE family efflux protein
MSTNENHQKNILDDERIGLLLLKLAVPAFMGTFVMTLYNVVDTIFIGRYVGSLGIAGLSIVFPLQMLTSGIGMITGMGGASLISRLIGSNNVSRAEHALGNSNILNIIISVTITVVGLSYTAGWLRMMGSSETILPYALTYMTIILIGLPFQTFSLNQNFLVRSEGNSRVAMTGMIIGAGLNIVLDAIFIIPLDMGIRGAAIATVISQVVSAAYFLWFYLTGRSYLKIRLPNFRIDWSLTKSILAIGFAGFSMTLAQSLAGIITNRVVIAYGGDLAIAVFGIFSRLMLFAIMPGMAINQGLQPILGFNYGAKRYGMALKSIKLAAIISTGFCIVIYLLIYLFPQPLMGIFTTDAELFALGTDAIKIFFLGVLLIGYIMVIEITFMATGKALQALIASLSRPAIILIPLIFILPLFWQLNGIWWAYAISEFITAILVTILVIPQIRMFTKEQHQHID